jgi:CheY-like chemotaxis protein
VWLEVDPIRMAQVLSNLLNNAAKYTKNNGYIQIMAEYKNDDVSIHVKDNGIGLSKHMLLHIFDMFTQVDTSFERAHGGMGIGLALVKNLIELHGGSIVAKSNGIGHGSEFIISLASASATNTPCDLDTKMLSPPPGKGKSNRILIIDDNENAARTMGWVMSLLFGQEVKLAYNGNDAITEAKRFLPDLILLDIGLPDMNGYDVCRKIRCEPSLRDTMIVALTGWGEDKHRQLSKEAGFNHHLVKPVGIDAIEKLLIDLDKAPKQRKRRKEEKK